MKKLNELLNIDKSDYKKYKIHLAWGGNPKDRLSALREYQKGKFKEWQEGQNGHNFQRDYIISLIFTEKDTWLFAGIYKSNKNPKPDMTGENKYRYVTELTGIAKDSIGKIVNYHRSFRSSYLCAENYIEDFVVSED